MPYTNVCQYFYSHSKISKKNKLYKNNFIKTFNTNIYTDNFNNKDQEYFYEKITINVK